MSLRHPETAVDWGTWALVVVTLACSIIAWSRSLETKADAADTYARKDSVTAALIEQRHILFGLDSSDRCNNRHQSSYCR